MLRILHTRDLVKNRLARFLREDDLTASLQRSLLGHLSKSDSKMLNEILAIAREGFTD
jgi:hypothetical protein